MNKVLLGVAGVVAAVGIGFGATACGGSNPKPVGAVCSYDADDVGCPAGVVTPDNDGNR